MNELRAAQVGKALQIANAYGPVTVSGGPERVVPYEVPVPSAPLVDQEALQDLITSLIRPAGWLIVVITGIPGSGRSTALHRWAHEHRDLFPGGQLYLDCAAYDNVEAIIDDALRSLGETEEFLAHASDGARENRFRSRTAAQATLVVLDNARYPAAVRRLLPKAPGSVVLSSAAGDLSELEDTDGAVICPLGPLTDTDASQLLSEIAGPERLASEPDAVAELIRACGGLPIAIRVVAGKLKRTPDLSITRLAAEIKRGDRRLSGEPGVAAVFGVSYRSLSRSAQRMYRRLGALPFIDFGGDIAGLVGDAGLISVLEGAGLLETRSGQRYGMHELVRAHARTMFEAEASRESPDAVFRPVVSYFLIRAMFTDLTLMTTKRATTADYEQLLTGHTNPFGDKDSARSWLDRERANLVRITETTYNLGWDETVWRLAEALTAYFFNYRRIPEWTTITGYGIRAARRCGNAESQSRLHLSASRAYCDLEQWESADEHLTIAMDLAERVSKPALLASAWEFRGRYLEALGDTAAALVAYGRAVEFNEVAGERRGVALAVLWSARLRGDLSELRRARDLFIELGDERMAGRALLAVGKSEATGGDRVAAFASLRQAIEDLGETHYAAEATEALAGIVEADGRHDLARQFLEAALGRYDLVGHRRADVIRKMLDPELSARGSSRTRCEPLRRRRHRRYRRVRGSSYTAPTPRATARCP
jgi:tetratricopeptide (TPR) repeat protein